MYDMRILAGIHSDVGPELLPERLAEVRAAGFDGVEIVLGAGGVVEPNAPEEACRALAEQAERYGLRVGSVLLADSPQTHTGSADGKRCHRALEKVRDILHRCAWLGARVVRWVPANLGIPAADGGACDEASSYQESLNATYLSLETLRLDCERSGVVAGVIPCHHGFLLSPPEFRELIDRVNSPLLAAALDCSACGRVGDPVDWIFTLQHRLAAVVVEAGAGSAGVRRALREVRFDGSLILTGDTAAADEVAAWREGVLRPS
ncbi:MAG: TIM barrel protein [bacterium]|nr:TIM barrel protein [bacterium]